MRAILNRHSIGEDLGLPQLSEQYARQPRFYAGERAAHVAQEAGGRVKIRLTFRGHVVVPKGAPDSRRWQSALALISDKGWGLLNVLVSCPFCLAHGSMEVESFGGVWPVLFCEREQKEFEVRFKEPVGSR